MDNILPLSITSSFSTMEVITTTCLSSLKSTNQDSDDKEQLTGKDDLPDSDPESLEEEEEEAEEDEHDSFLQKFLFSGHCTLCLYLTIMVILIGCFVALVVISEEVLNV